VQGGRELPFLKREIDMEFEENCKWLVDNARPSKNPPNPEEGLPYEQCSLKEKSRRINNMLGNIWPKNSTRVTLDRIYKR
jgi:hypothetical protein